MNKADKQIKINAHPYHWYACYTISRAEKKALKQLQDAGIEAYLPLQRRLHQWKDRKKWVEVPLINSYIFVRISEKEYFNVLNTNGVVRYIFFEGKAATIPDWQIETLKLAMASEAETEITTEKLEAGEPIVVKQGPFIGLHGEMIEYKGNKKIKIQIEHIGHTLLLTIPVSFVEKII